MRLEAMGKAAAANEKRPEEGWHLGPPVAFGRATPFTPRPGRAIPPAGDITPESRMTERTTTTRMTRTTRARAGARL